MEEQTKTLKPEESVIVVSCINSSFLEKVNELAKSEGITVVLTKDKVIYDYVESKLAGAIDENVRMTAFLSDERNQTLAREHAKEIWRIVSKGKPLEDAAGVPISIKKLVKESTLSWKKAEDIINTLSVFGLVKRNKNDMIFELVFDDDVIRGNVLQETTLSVESLNFDIQRFKAALQRSTDLTDSEKDEKLVDFKNQILNNIAF